LNLFDDATFSAVLDRRHFRTEKSFSWFGRVEGVKNSRVTLAMENGVMAGNIVVGESRYQVRYASDNAHVILEIDPKAFPKDLQPLIPPRGALRK
jgi:hypothetical protein